MSDAIKNFKGYAVGGDDTEWKKFIVTRFTEILDESTTEHLVYSDSNAKDDEDINEFINAMSSFVDVTQNVIGDITISHTPKTTIIEKDILDLLRGLV